VLRVEVVEVELRPVGRRHEKVAVRRALRVPIFLIKVVKLSATRGDFVERAIVESVGADNA